jgi:ABC-type transport system substrate-binding protein
MKKVTWLGLCVFLVAAMLLAACSTSTITATKTSTTASLTTTPPGGETALTVTEGSKVNNFSPMGLGALPSTTGNSGYILYGCGFKNLLRRKRNL